MDQARYPQKKKVDALQKEWGTNQQPPLSCIQRTIPRYDLAPHQLLNSPPTTDAVKIHQVHTYH